MGFYTFGYNEKPKEVKADIVNINEKTLPVEAVTRSAIIIEDESLLVTGTAVCIEINYLSNIEELS